MKRATKKRQSTSVTMNVKLGIHFKRVQHTFSEHNQLSHWPSDNLLIMSVHTQAEEGITGSTPCVDTTKDAKEEISGERLIFTSSGVLLQSCTNYVLLRHTTNICMQTHTVLWSLQMLLYGVCIFLIIHPKNISV